MPHLDSSFKVIALPLTNPTMNAVTQLEDLSNDIFFEIFEYLHALDLFMAFSSLNRRIASILSSTPLRVVISKLHCRYQMRFLSSQLIDHTDQVISISLQDRLRDCSSVIPFLFNQHTFINLRWCRFFHIHPSSNLHHVMQKLQSLTKLVAVRVGHSRTIPLSSIIKQNISKNYPYTSISHTSFNRFIIFATITRT